MVACPYCDKTEYQRKTGFSTKGVQRYKCLYCVRKYTLDLPPRVQSTDEPSLIECLQCGKLTRNPKFCSRSCAAKYNNVAVPKREKRQRFCKHCGAPVTGYRKVCDKCYINPRIDWSKRTIGQIQKSAKYQVSAALRTLARQEFAKSDRPRACQNCGYDKHVEVCHIKGINTFSPDTPVLVVSGIDNLVGLCPNCHWEFDHGLLLYENIPR